ncbi:MAG: hypothetical protein KVP17_001402 [Porospora cf. gigantea B]|uniref:uncharacterized protein n=1 Tax=Porospora cf. gigantea B TaxID=2853592 RepID=UPI003571EE14|nr:MAG: hypothetical protein KVP17_001402 [Porospora cf. gigantea B]
MRRLNCLPPLPLTTVVKVTRRSPSDIKSKSQSRCKRGQNGGVDRAIHDSRNGSLVSLPEPLTQLGFLLELDQSTESVWTLTASNPHTRQLVIRYGARAVQEYWELYASLPSARVLRLVDLFVEVVGRFVLSSKVLWGRLQDKVRIAALLALQATCYEDFQLPLADLRPAAACPKLPYIFPVTPKDVCRLRSLDLANKGGTGPLDFVSRYCRAFNVPSLDLKRIVDWACALLSVAAFKLATFPELMFSDASLVGAVVFYEGLHYPHSPRLRLQGIPSADDIRPFLESLTKRRNMSSDFASLDTVVSSLVRATGPGEPFEACFLAFVPI